eukprot:402613-Pelagomonas_calceolata.AAC.3
MGAGPGLSPCTSATPGSGVHGLVGRGRAWKGTMEYQAVMSDVRPWGKRSPDVPTAATTSMNRKNGVFLKRGQR